jgi:hypothetical protein
LAGSPRETGPNIRHNPEGRALKIVFGLDSAHIGEAHRVPVVWDSEKLINGHALIVGKSGTGKTFTLKRMLTQLNKQAKGKMRVHIMDVHGDIDIEGASTVKFSESTQYGFNPLAVNPDPDFGGVRKRVQYFLGALSRTSHALGSKQQAALRNILVDLYAANGFYEGRPESWLIDDGIPRRYPKKHPTLDDAVKFSQFKLKSMFLGTSSRAVGALEALNKKMNRFYSRQKQSMKAAHSSPEELEKIKAEITKLGEEAVVLFHEHIQAMQTGMELTDLIKYDSRDVMKSVVERLENLNNIGIFKAQQPPFDPNLPIWRYDIKALSADEKKLFVSFVLESIYMKAVQRGVQSDLVEVIVIDEAHNFLDDEPDNIINVIAKEARKFGVGLFCASQSPAHFSDDFISNVSSKIILGIDQIYWDASARKMKIDPRLFDWIVPHKRMIMQMNNKGETRNKFTGVFLKDPASLGADAVPPPETAEEKA